MNDDYFGIEVMKFTTLTFVLVVFIGSQCSRTSKSVVENGAGHSPVELQSHYASKEDLELRRRYEAVRNEIKRASENLELENLIDTTDDKGDEIRIWVGFGLTYPRCLILREVEGEDQASYMTVKTTRRRTRVNEKVEEAIVRTPLSSPKSGWDEFKKFLKRQGIESPLRIPSESNYTPDPDGQIIAVEVKSGPMYSMTFYHVDNKSEEAQRVLDLCRRVEQEFNIEMHCGRTAAAEK